MMLAFRPQLRLRVPNLVAMLRSHFTEPVRQYPLILIAIASVAFSITPIVNSFRSSGTNKDYTLWYQMGRIAHSEQSLYQPGENGEVRYMYPPTAAVLVYGPLSRLPEPLFVAALCLLTAFAWAFCLLVAFDLGWNTSLGYPRWVYLLPLLATGPFVYDLFLLGQINLVLLALVLACVWLNRNERPWLAGMCLGLAIAIKVFPLPMLFYWVLRRRWSLVAGCCVGILATGYVLPGCMRGFTKTNAEVQQWYALMVGDQSGNAMAARSSIGFTRRNQSLVSLSHRMLRPVECGDDEGDGYTVNIANVSPGTAQKLGYLACLLLGVGFLFATRLRFAPNHQTELIEIAMACIGIVLLSPLSWTYFYCWLLPAWVVVIGNLTRVRWLKYPALLAAVLLLSACSEQIHPMIQAYGVTAWGSVVLYLTLACLRWRLGRLDFTAVRPLIHADQR